MICPKCLTIETEGNLRCQKCGAQLHTGLFPKPVDLPTGNRPGGAPSRLDSLRTSIIAVGVFAAVVLALLLLLSRVETGTP